LVGRGISHRKDIRESHGAESGALISTSSLFILETKSACHHPVLPTIHPRGERCDILQPCSSALQS
jgi:hypothetical protein